MTTDLRRTTVVAVLLLALVAIAGLLWLRPLQRLSDLTQPDVPVKWWTLRSENIWDSFGLINAAVRCGDIVFLADMQSKVRPVDTTRTRQLPVLVLDGPPLALAADCPGHVLYALIPPVSGSAGATVVAVESSSGQVLRRYPLPTGFARAVYFSPPASLYIAGMFYSDPVHWRNATVDSYYDGSRVGLALSLNTGAVESLFEPYERRCIGAATCRNDVSLSPATTRSVVAQPTSTQIGVYDGARRLSRVIDITSPGFHRTGQVLPLNASAEEGVRWRAANSVLYRVFQFADHVATIHYRSKIAPDWIFGQPIHLAVLMNIHSHDGTLVRADVELPDLPLGQDDDGVFVIDYGERGRSGSSPEVTLSTVRVP